jgi:transposase-like protein
MLVALFSDRAKAEPLQKRLRDAGLSAEIHDELRLQKLWFVSKPYTGIRLEVPADQFERAEQLLLDFDATEGALREAIRCPECRSLRVEYPQFTRKSLLTNLSLGLAAQLGLVEKDYYCQDCHFTWPREGTRSSRKKPHQAPYYFIDGAAQPPPAGNPSEQERKAA